MNRFEAAESFLKLIAEIAKNDIGIDSNLVYSNLVNMNTKKDDISQYFDIWCEIFEKLKNVDISKNETHYCFSSFGFRKDEKNIKIQIALDKTHIYKGVNELIMFLSKNNIPHSTRVTDCIRNDDIIVSVNDLMSAEKVRKFVSGNDYIKEGLLIQNPFAFTDKYIVFIWEGCLSYNMVLSSYISDYINGLREERKLDSVSNIGFFNYLKDRYESIFKKGIGINEFASSRKLIDIPNELLNYKIVTEILINSLNIRQILKTFCDIYKSINVNKKENINRIKAMLFEEKTYLEVTPEQKEAFDYAYIEISKSSSEEYAIASFKEFVKEGNYRIFSRDNNVRNILQSSNITPFVMKELIYEEMKNALMNASIETIKKYGTVQLGRALFGIRDNDYGAFTNDNNVRRNLKLMISSEEIDNFLEEFLARDGYSPVSSDENYWVFIELMDTKSKEKLK